MTSDYFGDQIAKGQPIIPPTVEQAPVVPQQEAQGPFQTNAFIGLPVRANGDRIFLLKGGKKYWIANAQAYENLGFKFGDEVTIDEQTLAVLPEGEPIK